MTPVMRNRLLQVAANLLVRDGLPQLAAAIRSAQAEVAALDRRTIALGVLNSIAQGVVDKQQLEALAVVAATPAELALADQILEVGPTQVALATRLAQKIAESTRQQTAATDTG